MTAAVEPVKIGPTWQKNEAGGWLLPERTLGWQILRWVERWLLDDDGNPFTCTPEQARFLLWWYAVDERGIFMYRDGILQRLKGWGKDPIVAVICAVEFVGPCRFSHWATEPQIDDDIHAGDPVAVPHPSAWVQVAATSIVQTRNTMRLFPRLLRKAKAEFGIDIGKEIIYADHGSRVIEAVTSSPATLEGGRATFVVRNETHHWKLANQGHEMAAVIERNATKSKDGAARALSITNAYEPSEDSVAQRQREAWETEHSGLSISTGVLYDSLEAPPDATLRPPKRPDGSSPSEQEIREHLSAIIAGVRGDSHWLNIPRIVNSILDVNNPPSRSRRFWFNQVVASEDAWVDPKAPEAAIDPLAADARRGEVDQLRAGWLVMPDEPVVMFGDGSKSDDATGLVGCRLSDGYVFTLGVWQKPQGAKDWLVPVWDVDDRVQEAMGRFNVVGFWFDPSHVKDDEGNRIWDPLCDRWHRLYKEKLQFWSVKTGDRAHSVMWDMTSPERHKMFVAGAELFAEEMQARDEFDRFTPQFAIDGHPALVDHLRNARRNPTSDGVSLAKDNRESAKKIDLAVCAVGARMLRRISLNRGLEEEDEAPGEIW